jgi:RNA polymerase sigma factor for flagellar operon FliA
MEQSEMPDNRQLWADYGKTRSEKLRNLLMEHYLPLVKKIAQHIHTKLPREVELDDLVSAGNFGLMYAVAAFNPRRKVKFETYCGGRVRGAILDELRSWDWVPRLARKRNHQLHAAMQELEMELGRPPGEHEVAERLDVSPGELRKLTREGNLTRVLPLSRPAVSDTHHEQRNAEFIMELPAARRPPTTDRDDAKRLISGLSRAERLIVMLYYAEQMTMKQIGKTLDLSESRVSQMHSSILARLQACMGRVPETMAA